MVLDPKFSFQNSKLMNITRAGYKYINECGELCSFGGISFVFIHVIHIQLNDMFTKHSNSNIRCSRSDVFEIRKYYKCACKKCPFLKCEREKQNLTFRYY